MAEPSFIQERREKTLEIYEKACKRGFYIRIFLFSSSDFRALLHIRMESIKGKYLRMLHTIQPF